MNLKIRCVHCRRFFVSDRRVKNQRFCGTEVCQRARKNLWQRQKMANDPDYRANQKDCQKSWHKEHPHYWRDYRRGHPEYCRRNRLKQKDRDKKRRLRNLAKMDALKPISFVKAGIYYLVPDMGQPLAKMDALAQKIHVIPTCSP